MYKLQISPQAQADLLDIKSYIAFELQNPNAAQNTASKIIKAIRGLIRFPDSGAPLSSIVNIQTHYRFLVCGGYLIFYWREDDTVFVSRILYGRRDYLKTLFWKLSEDEIE